MVEVAPKLFCGNGEDFEREVADKNEKSGIKPGFAAVHAAKDPWHRALLGYTGRGAPKEDPEYLLARRDTRLYLNLVDTPDPRFFNVDMFNKALAFTSEHLSKGFSVLIHCNQGESRGPSLTLLHMAAQKLLPTASFKEAEEAFKKLYPLYAPKAGVRGFVEQNWQLYVG